MSEKRQSIIVTGGVSGIGKATVERLRRDGAAVFTVDRTNGADLVLDVTAEGASEAIVLAAQAAMEGIDGVVPCAASATTCRSTPMMTNSGIE